MVMLIIMRTNTAGQEFPIGTVGPFGNEKQARAYFTLTGAAGETGVYVPHKLPAFPGAQKV